MNSEYKWIKTASTDAFPDNGGMAVLVEGKQIAVFNFSRREKWYATDNRCPHKGEQCIARGMLGDSDGEPKVACPFHKRTFSLETGKCLNGEEYEISIYPVKIQDGFVFVGM